jgi:hypothetical protein
VGIDVSVIHGVGMGAVADVAGFDNSIGFGAQKVTNNISKDRLNVRATLEPFAGTRFVFRL